MRWGEGVNIFWKNTFSQGLQNFSKEVSICVFGAIQAPSGLQKQSFSLIIHE